MLSITRFDGIAPKLKPAALAVSQAQVAINCKLRGGALEPLRNSLAIVPAANLPSGTRTIFKFGEGSAEDESKYWLAWANDTNVSLGFIPKSDSSEERVYFTEFGKSARMTTYSAATASAPYPDASYVLGVPAPEDAPFGIGVTGLGQADTKATQYIFTHVVAGNESIPSPAVTVTTLPQEEKPVKITFPTAPGGVTHRRLYRKTAGVDYKKVGSDIAVTTTSFEDSVADADLGAVLYVSQAIIDVLIPAKPSLSYSGVVASESVRLAYSYYRPAWSWTEDVQEWVGDHNDGAYVTTTVTHNEAAAETPLSESTAIVVATGETVTISFPDTPPTEATHRRLYKKDGETWKYIGEYVKATNSTTAVYPIAASGDYPEVGRTYSAAGFSSPTLKPVLTSTAGVVSGTHEYMLTCLASAQEGLPSLVAEIEKIGGLPTIIESSDVAAETGVTSRRLYRKVSGTWRLVNAFASGETTFSDNLSDASLSSATAYTLIADTNLNAARPTAPLSAFAILDLGTQEARSYIYTFVTSLSEEGPPSPASKPVDVSFGQVVSFSMGSVPSGETLLAGGTRRIYRTATGNGGTNFYFVDEVPIAQSTYTDEKESTALGEPISSLDFGSPPIGMGGLMGLPNGFFAGFDGNEVWFSEPYRPHAWPLAYNLTCEFPVKALGVTGQSLLVLTDRFPYIATGSAPEQMTLQKIDFEQGCVSSRSVCRFMDGVVYASPDGLCMLGGGGPRVLTAGLFSREAWQLLKPETMAIYQHDGRLYVFHNDASGTGKGFVFTPLEAGGSISTLDYHASAGFNDTRLDRLFLCVGGVIKKAEESTAFKTYTWKSKKFILPSPSSFSWAQIVGEDFTPTGGFGLTFNLYVNGVLTYTKNPTSDAPFRLPPFIADYVEIELIGTSTVFEVHLAKSILELMNVA